MTPYLLFLYMIAVAGGLLVIGFVLLVLFACLVFARGLMLQGDKK